MTYLTDLQRKFDEERFPCTVQQWLEVSHGEGDWVTVGKAKTRLGLKRVLGSLRWRRVAEHDRPYLTSGGPRLGTARIAFANGSHEYDLITWAHD